VDDEEMVCIALRRLLQREGYACEAVAGAQEALHAIATDTTGFGLVLTDHNMPGLDGVGLVLALRAASFPGRILVHASPLDAPCRRAYERLRVDGFIEKPAQASTLLQAIQAAVENVPRPPQVNTDS
jgi:CheY-like chemotaxis protein